MPNPLEQSYCQTTKNNRKHGKERDSKILLTLEQWECCDTQMLSSLLFPDVYHKLRKCQERMKKLFDAGKVQRWKGEDGFVYSLEEQRGRWKHKLMANWVRTWLTSTCKQWEKIHSFEYEQDYGFLRADGLVVIKNNITGKFRFIFLEIDRATNAFDKVPKYNKLLQEQHKYDRWWMKVAENFPDILVVTTTEARRQKILEHVKAENENKLVFDVKLLGDIKREVVRG